MAFGGSLYGGSFTTACLDDVPFKLGPRFKPPTKVVLPANLEVPARSDALNAEYSFEVEEAVLKWSAEREKQLAEQRRLETEFAESAHRNKDEGAGGEDDGASEPLYENHGQIKEPLYENRSILVPKPAPRPKVKPKPKDEYVNVLVPNPLIANISNGILQPTPSSSNGFNSGSGETGENKNSESNKPNKSSDLDLTWFEKEDNPFDDVELQSINDLEELASVLEETKKVSPEPPAKLAEVETILDVEKSEPNVNGTDELDRGNESPTYENVELKMVDLKIGADSSGNAITGSGMSSLTNLPPVPPRRDLVGRSPPLPPIGKSSSDPSVSIYANDYLEKSDAKNEQNELLVDSKEAFQTPGESKVISKRRTALPKPAPKPQRTFAYSRHTNDSEDIEETNESNYDNIQPKVSIESAGKSSNVQFQNYRSSHDSRLTRSSEDLNFVSHHFGEDGTPVAGNKTEIVRPRIPQRPAPPPPRPQSWNKFSPLPPTSSPRSTEDRPDSKDQPNSVSLPKRDRLPSSPPDLYSKLSKEAQTCVDNLTSMGFPKDRVARAVQKVGLDEKEVVEYLCLVDQLIEKGYNTYLAENALLLFKNSMQQASAYLELFTQMQELGFNGEKIKEALVNTNNDREKTLDILTASS